MSIALPEVEKVNALTIWGQGTMGRTWSLAALLGGFEVHVHEPNEGVSGSARTFIENTLDKIEGKKGPKGLKKDAMARLHFVDRESATRTGTPIHLEVIPENLKRKCEFFGDLGKELPDGAVLWSNTSCLNVEKMANASGRPAQFVGAHGMNPVHLMKGVEAVRTDVVDEEVFAWTMQVLERLGKVPIPAKNVPGFIVNKLFVPFALDAVRLLWRGEADIATIDTALNLSLGHPQGCMKLLDLICHDVMVDVANELHTATQDPRFVVPPEYLKMKEVGNLGFKAARGFYNWAEPRNPVPVPFDELLETAV